MRAIRTILVVTAAAVAAVGVAAAGAGANGGALLELDGGSAGTYFVAGDRGEFRAQVSIPRSRRGILDRGPFFVYIGPRDVIEGRPLPTQAVRVATLSVVAGDAGVFDLRASFTVPDVAPGPYRVSICNEPCTVAGFREPLIGYLEVVTTHREAGLLVERDRLSATVAGLRREMRRDEREDAETEARLAQAQQDNAWFADEVNRLNHELETASSRPSTGGRPLVGTWPALAVGLSLALVAAALARRRGPAIRVPDTIEELSPEPPTHAEPR